MPANTTRSRKPESVLLAASTVLAGALASHHPTIGSPTPEQALEEVARESTLNGAVHGGLIAIILLWWVVIKILLRRLTEGSLIGGIGLTCYGAGIAAHVVAANCSGFLTPHLAATHPSDAPAELFIENIRLVHAANQTADRLGIALMTVGVACLASLLLRAKGEARIAGSIALVGSLAAFGVLLTDWQSIGVGDVWVFLIGQAAWNLGLAWVAFRARLDE